MCHLVFLAPILALPVFWLLPFSLALPIYLGVVGVTGLVLWPAVIAMRRPQVTGREGMIGARGQALTALNPNGLVRCQGEVWAATAQEPVPDGERVWVLGVDRLRLTVGRRAPQRGDAGQGHPCHPVVAETSTEGPAERG